MNRTSKFLQAALFPCWSHDYTTVIICKCHAGFFLGGSSNPYLQQMSTYQDRPLFLLWNANLTFRNISCEVKLMGRVWTGGERGEITLDFFFLNLKISIPHKTCLVFFNNCFNGCIYTHMYALFTYFHVFNLLLKCRKKQRERYKTLHEKVRANLWLAVYFMNSLGEHSVQGMKNNTTMPSALQPHIADLVGKFKGHRWSWEDLLSSA